MSVFLRWGVFGILAVAALMYAYNASKRMAERRQASPPAAASAEQGAPDSSDEQDEPGASADPAVSPECEEELLVAEVALQARRDGEPIDRLLRNQTIAFQADAKRRERLESVARKWFERVGADPDTAELRGSVLRDCWRFSPAP